MLSLIQPLYIIYRSLPASTSSMLQYCEEGTSISEPWVQKGLAPCFLDTVSSAILLGITLIFGIAQILVYRKYSLELPIYVRPNSRWFRFQIILHFVIPFIAIIRVILRATVIEPKGFYGHEILWTLTTLVVFPIAVWLVLLERRRQLPSVPAWGHGLVLLCFWALAVAAEAACLTSWFSPLWWWKERKWAPWTLPQAPVRCLSCFYLFQFEQQPGIVLVDYADGLRHFAVCPGALCSGSSWKGAQAIIWTEHSSWWWGWGWPLFGLPPVLIQIMHGNPSQWSLSMMT